MPDSKSQADPRASLTALAAAIERDGSRSSCRPELVGRLLDARRDLRRAGLGGSPADQALSEAHSALDFNSDPATARERVGLAAALLANATATA